MYSIQSYKMVDTFVKKEHVFFTLVLIVFIYFLYHQYIFQKEVFFFSYQEAFTPKHVNAIIQQPNANQIGTMDVDYVKKVGIKTVSNGYNKKTINNLKPSNPQPFSRYSITSTMGNFSTAEENIDHELPTKEFEFPNNHKFTVEYDCRETATGMFTDCGVYSANTAWTADPYKGLNCPLQNTKTPNITNDYQRKREIQYNKK